MLALACSKPAEDTTKDEAAARELLKMMIEQGDNNDGGLAERAQYDDDDYPRAGTDNGRADAQFWHHVARFIFGK